MEYLFIAGCARSGTTAMARLLNQDPRILIGIERYKYIPKATRPHISTKKNFRIRLRRNAHIAFRSVSS